MGMRDTITGLFHSKVSNFAKIVLEANAKLQSFDSFKIYQIKLNDLRSVKIRTQKVLMINCNS